MRRIIIVALLLSTGCSTLDQSVRLGGTIGLVAGGAATYAAQSSSGNTAPPENVGISASIGLALGLITAYYTHKAVAEDRDDHVLKGRIDHGDLPPSPFIFPTNSKTRR
jgi:hypothetical protein